MTIKQIAERLNSKAFSENHLIATLPELRKKFLKKKNLPDKIFTWQTIFDNEFKYAYHNGGRGELQFNFGQEFFSNGKAFTRYALCFSLEVSPSLLNPIQTLEPYRIRFNQCIESFPEHFQGFKMFYHRKGVRYGDFDPQLVPENWFQLDTFICLGRIIKKPLSDLTEADLEDILIGFDKLLPIYNYTVLQVPNFQLPERRISKVCWNENGWTYPSGAYGKSKEKNSHEQERGYGHEEWLFDFDKQIDGYHYAFLQSAYSEHGIYIGKTFDLRLYSHNADTKENLWIGSIKNMEVISSEDANKAFSIYKKQGWLNEMIEHIRQVDGDVNNFQKLNPAECFNVRFKPEYAKLDIPFKAVTEFTSIIGTYHYKLIHEKGLDKTPVTEKDKIRTFVFKPGFSDKLLSLRVSNRQKRIVQSYPLHDKIQKILFDHLIEEHGQSCVGMESDTGISTRIDLCVKSSKGITLYEVKSYPSVLTSIRMALGQLIEYSFYPNPIENLNEMIIVSHLPIEPEGKAYLECIRKTTSLKLFYQSVDVDRKEISRKY